MMQMFEFSPPSRVRQATWASDKKLLYQGKIYKELYLEFNPINGIKLK